VMLAFLILFNLTSMRSLWNLFSTSTSSRKIRNPLAWMIQQTSSIRPSSSTLQTPTTLQTNLMSRASTCRQPLAQLPMLATGFSQSISNSKYVVRYSGGIKRAGLDGSKRKRCTRSSRLRQGRRSKVFSSLEREIIRSLESFGVDNQGRGFGRRQKASNRCRV